MLALLRHGRTAWNREGRFQGWADVPLDGEGREQARRAAGDLAGVLSGPAVVLSSDLRRARVTAEAVAEALGTAVVADDALREVDVGDWEGLTQAEAADRHPDTYRRWATGADVRRGGGETLAEAGARVARRIEAELGRTAADGIADVVVVGHGMSLQAAMAVLRERGLVGFDGGAPHLDNGGWVLLRPLTARPVPPDARTAG